ncbi:MAG TPA: pyrimidine reductase family protein [Acidimicrobiales bacterium]|nr:pyrimidine reductase family protein [Acidimicrobiales bacterium]
MRALLPQPSEQVSLVEMYSQGLPALGAPPGARPYIRTNMISSLDGAVAVAGRSGGLGGPADRSLFHLLRALADVVLVGAGTVRIERYGPPRLPPELQEMRLAHGRLAVPAVAIVSQSANLDWSWPLFTENPVRPIIITPGNTDATALARAREAADVLTTGAGGVDLEAAMKALAERGVGHVLCEGGPTLNTSLAAAGLVDELCLTLSPQLAGCVGGVLLGGWLGSAGVWLSRTEGTGERAFRAQPLAQLVRFSLAHLLEQDGYLFLRLVANRGTTPA